MMQVTQDRRKRVRLRVPGVGHFVVVDPGFPARTVHSGRFALRDISLHGAGIEIEALPKEHAEALAQGSKALVLLLDNIVGSALCTIASVRSIRGHEHGPWQVAAEFDELAPEHADKLRHYMFELFDKGGASLGDAQSSGRLSARRYARAAVAAAAVLLGIAVGHLATYLRHSPSPEEPATASAPTDKIEVARADR
jgi:hypothetical protein